MRITFNMQATRYTEALTNSLSAIDEAQRKINSKKNLINPEDDPSRYVAAYSVQRMLDEIEQFGKNASNASSWLKNADNELQQAIKLLATARDDLAVNGSSSSNDAESRKALAGDVLNIYNSLMDIANANYMGRYIFGGFATDKPPFSGGGNQVTGVISVSRNGGEATAKTVFEDMPELQSGSYTAKISIHNGMGMLSLYDSKGNAVILDSNGGDESGDGGNKSSTVLTFDYKPGAVINTGRGVSFKLPETAETGLTLKFSYESGSEMSYAGDLGSILSKIGYNQDVAINMPGSEIFSQTYKTLQGSRLNTVNGMAATLATYFSQLDKSNGGLGDSIKVSGTDHNGNLLGSASISSPANSALDLTDATEKERTLTIGYGDKLYKIVVPQGSYAGMDELTAAINHELKNAEYLGSLNIPAGGLQNMDAYANYVDNKIKSGGFAGEISPGSQNYYTDLSEEIRASADGSRLQFSTSKTGDNVRLTITGKDGGLLGFKNNTIASEGKDTVFEVGYDFHKTQVEVVRNTHEDTDFSGNAVKFFINGTMVSVPSAKSTVTLTGQIFPTVAADPDYSITVKGKTIVIPATDFVGATTDAAKEAVINTAIANAGLGAEAQISNLNTAAGTFDITTIQSQKELEFSLDKALRAAGLGFTVSASAEESVPALFGHYDISFSLVNNNADRSTQLTTTWYDENTVPPSANMLTAALNRTDLNIAREHTLGDFADFIKDLYDNSVDVTVKDGRLVIKDLRSGQSRMTVNLSSGNEGVGHPTDQNTVMGGKYTGAFDNTWTVNVATDLSRSGQRDVTIRITDKNGNVIYDKKTENYVGGGIQLPYGVTIDPNDMGLRPPATGNTAQFNVNLKANSSVAFGDMNVVENGQNVNIFRALKNLEHALMYNITKNGFSEPSAWRDSTLSSTASPYFDGEFKGSFNDEWTYEILQNNGLNKAYLQNEYKQLSGNVSYDAATVANLGSVMSFGVDTYDNVSGENKRVNVNIDLSAAVPPITDAASARDYILKELNDNPDLRSSGIRFVASDGKIEMQSGSGTKIASFASTATGNEKALADYVMGFDVPANGKLTGFPLTVNPGTTFNLTDIDSDPAINPDYPITKITVPAGTYNTPEELLQDLNAQLQAAAGAGGTDGRIIASLDAWGGIKFSLRDGSAVSSTVADGMANPLNITTTLSPAGRADVFSSAAQKAKTDLSEASDEARTMSFTYMAGVPPRRTETAITLDKKAYSSEWEVAEAINDKLAAQGITAADMKAVLTSDGKLAFTGTSGRFQNMTVQGDHTGTLGFPKAGDQAKIKVTDSSGAVVQEAILESANKTVDISDGLNLGFGVGFLSATDSFTGAIGSGIESELGTLDQAQNQLLKAITALGNRASRVESVTKFQETVKAAGENTKAGYLQSTELDQIKAMTELTQAKAAYETALTAAQTIMSISILDFLK